MTMCAECHKSTDDQNVERLAQIRFRESLCKSCYLIKRNELQAPAPVPMVRLGSLDKTTLLTVSRGLSLDDSPIQTKHFLLTEIRKVVGATDIPRSDYEAIMAVAAERSVARTEVDTEEIAITGEPADSARTHQIVHDRIVELLRPFLDDWKEGELDGIADTVIGICTPLHAGAS